MGWGWSEKASQRNCCLNQNPKVSRKEPDGEEKGKDRAHICFMPHHASVSMCCVLPWLRMLSTPCSTLIPSTHQSLSHPFILGATVTPFRCSPSPKTGQRSLHWVPIMFCLSFIVAIIVCYNDMLVYPPH